MDARTPAVPAGEARSGDALRLIALAGLLAGPMASGYAGVAACPIEEGTGAAHPWRPPAWVFRTVWPPLYLSLGVALVRTPAARELWALWALLTAWPLARAPGCADAPAVAHAIVVAAAALATARAYPRRLNPELRPLSLWLLFAATISCRK